MPHYAVLVDCFGNEDDVWEVDWQKMTDQEKKRFDQDCSQCIGMSYLGVYEAADAETALAIALEKTADWDIVPGA